jgi:hypothetical protein
MRVVPWRGGVSPSLQAVHATKHTTMNASACVLQSEYRFVCEYTFTSGGLLVMNKKQGLWCGRYANKHKIIYTRRTCTAYPLNWIGCLRRDKLGSYELWFRVILQSAGKTFGNNTYSNKLEQSFWQKRLCYSDLYLSVYIRGEQPSGKKVKSREKKVRGPQYK